MKTVARGLVVLLGVAVASAAIAASDPPPGISGSYLYSSIRPGPDGKPPCQERWTFDAGGVHTIESGQEVAHARYRVELLKGDGWLVETPIDTNGLPDCYGHRFTAGPPTRRLYFYWNSIGGFVLCGPPTQYKGRKVVSGCYAHVEPQR